MAVHPEIDEASGEKLAKMCIGDAVMRVKLELV